MLGNLPLSIKPVPLEWLITSAETTDGAVLDSAFLLHRVNQAILNRPCGLARFRTFASFTTDKVAVVDVSVFKEEVVQNVIEQFREAGYSYDYYRTYDSMNRATLSVCWDERVISATKETSDLVAEELTEPDVPSFEVPSTFLPHEEIVGAAYLACETPDFPSTFVSYLAGTLSKPSTWWDKKYCRAYIAAYCLLTIEHRRRYFIPGHPGLRKKVIIQLPMDAPATAVVSGATAFERIGPQAKILSGSQNCVSVDYTDCKRQDATVIGVPSADLEAEMRFLLLSDGILTQDVYDEIVKLESTSKETAGHVSEKDVTVS